MSAAEALRMAHAAGIDLAIDEGDLVLGAPSEPPSAVLDLLRQYKAGIVELLQRGVRVRYCTWSAEDWRAFFGERAGIAEFDGGLSRAEAEACAFAHCLAEWLNHNSMYSPPGHCFDCGGYSYCVIGLDKRRRLCAARYSMDIAPGWLRERQSGVGGSSQLSLRYVVRGGRAAPRD